VSDFCQSMHFFRALCGLLLAVAVTSRAQFIEDCGLEIPGPVVPVETKRFEHWIAPGAPTVSRQVSSRSCGKEWHKCALASAEGIPTPVFGRGGALAGKVVYLSPGHGFTWTETAGLAAWLTQRGNTNSIVEDLVSNETLAQYLIPMLQNAGAQVFSVREADLNSNLVILDNGEAGYRETGSGFSTSTVPGWGRPTFPMDGTVLPFGLGTNRLMSASATPTAQASYSARLPEDGFYSVSISYTQFTARVSDAHVVVKHAGGETHFRINQQRHGGTWIPLGEFYFKASNTAEVTVLNDSVDVNNNISLDAVKFGGGLGLIERAGPGSSSQRPRYEESARYQAQFAGAPLNVFAPNSNLSTSDRNNDVGTRSRWAAWMHEPGEEAVYVAWHTNAFNASATGTNTYVYGPNPPDGTYNFTGTPGSDALATAIHNELINDIKAFSGLNRPTWVDRGVDSAYFGELNPNNNSEMPQVLVEVAFHDALADATLLKEPSFRYLAARALAQGIIKYFAAKDGVSAQLFPEPPTHVAALNQPGGDVVIRWRAPITDTQNVRGQAAQKYRVYSSDDGLSWDNGVETLATAIRLPLPQNAAKYFRVTALNRGGESFPSSVVGAKAPVSGQPFALIVNAFERLEAAIAPIETFPTRYDLGNVVRVLLPRMNDGANVRLYGAALASNNLGFDSADVDAVSEQDIPAAPYSFLVWFNARGKNRNTIPGASETQVLRAVAARRQPIFLSGNFPDEALLSDVFQGVPGIGTGGLALSMSGAFSRFQNLPLKSDFGSPQVVAAGSSAASLGAYDTGVSAAIGTPGRSVYFGFSWEAVSSAATRTEILSAVTTYLLPAPFDGGLGSLDAGPPSDGGISLDPELMAPDASVSLDAGAGLPSVVKTPLLATLTLGPAEGCGCGINDGSWLWLALLWRTRKSHRVES
jgi:hypothetical protein